MSNQEPGEEARGWDAPAGSRGFWPMLVLLVVAASVLVALQMRRPKPADRWAGRPLPPLEVAGWLNAQTPLETEQLRGKVVLVHYWATNCGPCVRALPEIADYQRRFAGEGVEIVGLTFEPAELRERIEQVATRFDMHWPIGYGAGLAFDALGIPGTPTYLLYDRSGRSVWGGHRLDGLEDATIAALALN